MTPETLPLSLYVHLPWCVRKCPYCDFNSYESKSAPPDLDYAEALLRDFETELRLASGRPICSIFIGGGTPSLFSAAAIARLLDGIRARAELSAEAEITLEANPGAVEAARFEGYREAGVNRLSIGVQSFRDSKLALLGRVHDSGEAVRAVELARGAGFDNLNLDIMYALPQDDLAGAVYDLETALALDPPHLSWYQLTLEPSTAFHRKPPALPDEDLVAEIERQGRSLLAQRGYARYEISAYAKPGRRCAHNLNYWQFGDYLGIGAGAHGKLTSPCGAIVRRSKPRNPRTYMERAGSESAVSAERIESAKQIILEFMMGALRLPDGVSTACFEHCTGLAAASIAKPLAEAVGRGWMAAEEGLLKPTASGLQFLNTLLQLY
ncbi:MAG TPA: radical SAM family heme chaperone HemW [Gammaproteobacteria bacterium]|nr:radical SAM family heme chaperone HemW [Gammaproteobacteria bacterium]